MKLSVSSSIAMDLAEAVSQRMRVYYQHPAVIVKSDFLLLPNKFVVENCFRFVLSLCVRAE